MNNLKSVVLLGMIALFASCATSNDVVSDGLFQKRKYRKGFYFDKNADKGISKTTHFEEEIADNTKLGDNSESTTSSTESFQTKKSVELTVNESVDNNDVVNTTTNESVNNSIAVSKTDSHIAYFPKKNDIRFSKSEVKINTRGVAASVAAAESGLMLIILIILCLIIPPVAIAIYQGITTWFWIDLLLLILAISGWFLLGGLSGLAGLAAVIIAFLVIFDVI